MQIIASGTTAEIAEDAETQTPDRIRLRVLRALRGGSSARSSSNLSCVPLEAIERDMVQVRLTGPFRFIVVGAPEYLARNGVPRRPEDLLRHEWITYRALSTGAPSAWELERGKRNWRVPVRGAVTSNDGELCLTAAQLGLGLTYTFEPSVAEQLRDGRLQCVLEPYAATVPGFFLYYPSRAQSSPALRMFVDVAKEVLARRANTLR